MHDECNPFLIKTKIKRQKSSKSFVLGYHKNFTSWARVCCFCVALLEWKIMFSKRCSCVVKFFAPKNKNKEETLSFRKLQDDAVWRGKGVAVKCWIQAYIIVQFNALFKRSAGGNRLQKLEHGLPQSVVGGHSIMLPPPPPPPSAITSIVVVVVVVPFVPHGRKAFRFF